MNQVVVKQEKSGYQIVEAYKSLRTNLQFCGEDKKVIALQAVHQMRERAVFLCSSAFLLQRAEKE